MEAHLNDEDMDTHLCLVCQQTIVGLMEYVAHKKSGCLKKPPSSQSQQSHPQHRTFSTNSQLYRQSYSQSSASQESPVLPSNQPGTSHHSSYSLSSQDNFVLPTFQQDEQFGSQPSGYHHQQNSHNASDHAYNAAQPDGGQSSSGLDVDVTSPLSSLFESPFSPGVDGSVDPNSVLQGTGSSQSRPDFFHSLELERKGGEKTAEPAGKNLRSRRKGFPEEFDVDLPITMILSNLEFSSDEETGGVPFSSEGFDLDGSDSEWVEPPPPRSHTGGKWKPGQGPSKPYHPHQPNGGKWKPGQRPTRRSSMRYARGFYCNTCKMTFTDRLAFSTHMMSYEHKEVETTERTGKSMKQSQEVLVPTVPSTVLDPTTGEMVTVTVSQAVQNDLQPNILIRQQNNITICDVCDLYFDTIKMYEIHCETKQHRDALARKTEEIHNIMLGTTDTFKSEEMQSQSNSVTESSNGGEQAEANSKEKKPLPEIHYCEVCKKTFARKYEMARHLLTQFHRQRALKHPKALEMLNRYDKYVIRLCPYQCNVCQFYFNRPSDLLDHLLSDDHMTNCQDLVGPLLCVPCKYKTQSPDHITEHVQSRSHKESVAKSHHVCIIRECHSKITCKFCGVQMHSAVRMKRHIEVRHKDRKAKDRQEMHVKDKDPVDCPECSITFRCRYDLRQHFQRKHAKVRPYKCDVCNKTYIDSRGLASHNETSMHQRRVREHQLALEYLVTKNESDSETKTEPVIKNADPSTDGRKKKRGRKRKAEVREPSPARSRPRRSIQRPKRYFGTDNSGNEEADDNENSCRDVNNYEASVTKAIETVLELEKNSESGNPNTAAENCLPEIHGVDVGAVESIETDQVLEEVLGTIDDSLTDEQGENPTGLLKLEVEEEDDGNDTDNNNSQDDGGIILPEENTSDPESMVKEDKIRSEVKKLNLFQCKHCDFTAGDSEELRVHASEQHPSEVTKCEPCSQVFLSKKAYKIHCAGSFHQKNLNNCSLKQDMFVCSHCNKKHADEKAHKLHVEFVHLHVSTEEGIARVCQGRDSVTLLYGDELKQLEKVNCRSTVACPECGVFLQKSNLIEHLRNHTGERPFKCRHCTKTFSSPNSLRRHLIDHIGITPQKCEECGQTFTKQGYYAVHMKIHENKKKGIKFECDICNAVFYLEKLLLHHKKRHGDRKFKCPVEGCHWTFVLKVELDEHMFTHTREKKFLCDICGFETGTKTRMRRHAKTHEPVKEIACEYCPYKSSCKIHLKRHMRIHIGIKPFKCLYCDYACNTAENIRKHILQTRKHKGEKLYPCRFCEFKCNCGKDFRQHLLQCHMDYLKTRASESLMVFTGLYRPEEDIAKPPEGSEIHQVMKGRFVKVYDGTRLGGTGEAVGPPKKRSKASKRPDPASGTAVQQLQPAEIQCENKTDVAVIVNQDLTVSDTTSAVSLVSQQQPQPQQQPVPSVPAMEIPVYPRGLPWTVVAPNNRTEAWIPQGQVVDMVVSQPAMVRTNQSTGTATFINNPATLSNIFTTISVDGTSYPPLEPGTYQIIAPAGSDTTTITNLSVIHQ